MLAFIHAATLYHISTLVYQRYPIVNIANQLIVYVIELKVVMELRSLTTN